MCFSVLYIIQCIIHYTVFYTLYSILYIIQCFIHCKQEIFYIQSGHIFIWHCVGAIKFYMTLCKGTGWYTHICCCYYYVITCINHHCTITSNGCGILDLYVTVMKTWWSIFKMLMSHSMRAADDLCYWCWRSPYWVLMYQHIL